MYVQTFESFLKYRYNSIEVVRMVKVFALCKREQRCWKLSFNLSFTPDIDMKKNSCPFSSRFDISCNLLKVFFYI
jgi:hypothetical protein